jgi:hypothetical protein
MEQEILCNLSPNTTLAPLLQYLNQPTSLQHFRQLMGYLNTFQTDNRRNDYIYGAAQYMANTLGIKILDTSTATRLDQPMTDIEIKQAWRMAPFRCCCPIEGRQAQQYGDRSFCLSCSYFIHRRYDPTCQGCPTCHANESWQSFNAPCLACQLATITYQNPWVNRYNKLLDLWLNVSETHSNMSKQEMLVRRNQTFENSFSEMRARASRAETKIVFENLSQLQESFKLIYITWRSRNALMT